MGGGDLLRPGSHAVELGPRRAAAGGAVRSAVVGPRRPSAGGADPRLLAAASMRRARLGVLLHRPAAAERPPAEKCA